MVAFQVDETNSKYTLCSRIIYTCLYTCTATYFVSKHMSLGYDICLVTRSLILFRYSSSTVILVLMPKIEHIELFNIIILRLYSTIVCYFCFLFIFSKTAEGQRLRLLTRPP